MAFSHTSALSPAFWCRLSTAAPELGHRPPSPTPTEPPVATMTDWAAAVITGNSFTFPAGSSPPTINFNVFTGPVTNNHVYIGSKPHAAQTTGGPMDKFLRPPAASARPRTVGTPTERSRSGRFRRKTGRVASGERSAASAPGHLPNKRAPRSAPILGRFRSSLEQANRPRPRGRCFLS